MAPEEDGLIPKFKTYADGEAIAPVDPEDIKRMREFKRPRDWSGVPSWKYLQDMQAACSPGADITAITQRCHIITTLAGRKLISPWQHGEELHDAVFRLAATFPLRHLKYKTYMISGDERFGFDPNAFVQRLIEETGISHVWEPVQTKIPEGGRCFVTMRVPRKVTDPRGPLSKTEREAKSQARQVLWDIWKRFSPMGDKVLSFDDKEVASQLAAKSFANFLLDNIDLVRQLEGGFRDPRVVSLDPILSDLERKAQSSF